MPTCSRSLSACGPSPQPFGFPPDPAYIWGAVGFLWGMLIVYTAGATVALRLTNPPAPQPTGGRCTCGSYGTCRAG